jgi:hypothetical protein
MCNLEITSPFRVIRNHELEIYMKLLTWGVAMLLVAHICLKSYTPPLLTYSLSKRATASTLILAMSDSTMLWWHSADNLENMPGKKP